MASPTNSGDTADPRAGVTGSVELESVTKSYAVGAPPAVDEVSLRIEPGEFFSLLGPSGSGKTTTLRLIAGFEAPDRGLVRLGGADVTGRPPYDRDVNTVFQNYALFPHLSVQDNVAFPLRMSRCPKAEAGRRIAEALELVEMHGYERRLPHQLSGGQRQRVALARALVSRPQVVLLDEPLGALDLRLRHQMQLVLVELQREVGCTFVYVTHDQGEALGMSDRLAVMADGRIQQVGHPTELYYRPASSFVAGFVGKSNVLPVTDVDGELARVGGLALRLPRKPAAAGCTIVIRYEAIEVEERDSPGERDGGHNAVVQDVIFLGDGLEVALDVGGQRLIARTPGHRVARLARGDAVRVRVDPDDIVVLDD